MTQSIYDLDTPVLLVDLDRLHNNLQQMAQIASQHGKGLRPHTKTHKVPEIAKMQLELGAIGLTVAKLAEAEVLADAGCTNLFVANQIVGKPKWERLASLLERANVMVAGDSVELADALAEEMYQRGKQLSVLMEVDTGLARAGVRSIEEGRAVARRIADAPSLQFAGIFTHEGHLYKDPAGMVTAANQVAEQMRQMAETLASDGIPCGIVSVGSTPGASLLAPEAGITEIRPGVYVFYDRMQTHRGATLNQCALTVLATVTSVRSDGRIILDSGSKTLAGDLAPDSTVGEILAYPDQRLIGFSEEHGILFSDSPMPYKVGDKVQIVPNHACTCINMHDSLIAHRDGQVEAVWKIAGRGKIH